jgi:hypothetical protein
VFRSVIEKEAWGKPFEKCASADESRLNANESLSHLENPADGIVL